MRQVEKDKDMNINFITKIFTNSPILIPKNVARKQHMIPAGIRKGLETKVNVYIGKSVLPPNICEKVSIYRILSR